MTPCPHRRGNTGLPCPYMNCHAAGRKGVFLCVPSLKAPRGYDRWERRAVYQVGPALDPAPTFFWVPA